jgi:AcrR family transcriptional regulator
MSTPDPWHDLRVSPHPAVDVRWSPETSSGGRRPLSRSGIVATAVHLADAEGLAAVSMPRLARELGAAPMSLYRHVPDKDALVDLMIDAAVGAPPALHEGSWRERLAVWARANRAVFVAHRWTLALVSGARRMGPAELTWAEAALRILVDAGASRGTALRVLLVVNSYVRGASAPLGDRAPAMDDLRASGRLAEFPLLGPLLDGAGEEPGDEFEFGLTVVLDGVAATVAAG